MGEPVAEHRLRKVLLEAERQQLAARARAVLDANWRGSSTVPSRSLYPHQWSWDAAFIAIGRSRVEQERAQRELESMFEAQWSTGMLPHIKFDPQVPDDAYFPGPGFWQADRSPAAPRGVPTSGATRTATAWPRSSIPGSPARTTRRCGTPTSTTWRSRPARCRPTSATTCATPTRPTGPPTPPTTATSTWP